MGRVDEGEVQPAKQILGFGGHGRVVQEQTVAALAAQKQVGNDAEVVAQRQVLPHDRHPLVAGAEGVGRAVNQAIVVSFLVFGAFNYAFTQMLLATHPNILVIR